MIKKEEKKQTVKSTFDDVSKKEVCKQNRQNKF